MRESTLDVILTSKGGPRTESVNQLNNDKEQTVKDLIR